MRQSVVLAAPGFTDRFEGKLGFMYTDHLGLVTTGRGNLIDFGRPRNTSTDPVGGSNAGSAAGLSWKRAGVEVDTNTVREAFWTVKNAWPAVQSTACAHLTDIRLDDAAIDALFVSKLAEMWATLLHYFPGADRWCADAQLGIASMAWASGPAFSTMFPHFTLAANTGDWDICAGPPGDANTVLTARGQAWLRDGDPGQVAANRNPGLRPRNLANKVLFANAAVVGRFAMDPDVLYYPQALPLSGAV